jgi:hypothetical protein
VHQQWVAWYTPLGESISNREGLGQGRQLVIPGAGILAPGSYSPNVLERPSEKGRRGLQHSPTDRSREPFGRRNPAKFTLKALLEPLFGQSQKMNSRKFATRKQLQAIAKITHLSDVPGSRSLLRWLRYITRRG